MGIYPTFLAQFLLNERFALLAAVERSRISADPN
jgi:hypothetical protein